jgi:eukaryotic-like serine/threonine-protein kinase
MDEESDDLALHKLVKKIFLEVCERPPEGQRAFLDGACGGDAALRAEVESLLAFHSNSPSTRRDGVAATTAAEERATTAPGLLDMADVVGATLSERYEIHGELGGGWAGSTSPRTGASARRSRSKRCS